MSEHLKEGRIAPELISEMISGHEAGETPGAVAIFMGQVREDLVDGKRVTGIEYSAYPEMTGQVVDEIADRLRQSYPELITVRIIHSIGWVAAGEHSLAVMVTSLHRKQAFEALEECVELIKERLPVWKKEIFSDGSFRWVDPGH